MRGRHLIVVALGVLGLLASVAYLVRAPDALVTPSRKSAFAKFFHLNPLPARTL